jgi:hypothetical protein
MAHGSQNGRSRSEMKIESRPIVRTLSRGRRSRKLQLDRSPVGLSAAIRCRNVVGYTDSGQNPSAIWLGSSRFGGGTWPGSSSGPVFQRAPAAACGADVADRPHFCRRAAGAEYGMRPRTCLRVTFAPAGRGNHIAAFG